jgi:uncharacterized cofD-like protein
VDAGRKRPVGARSLTLSHNSGIFKIVSQAGDRPAANGHTSGRWRLLWRWFQPGLGVKRWVGAMIVGTALIGLGLAVYLLDIYRAHPDSPLMALLSLRVMPREVRALLFGLAGIALFFFAVIRLNRALLEPYIRPGKPVVEVVAEHRRRERGPRVTVMGGGTGLSTMLRGLKAYTGNLTAIVTVADDGGSSGRLRRSMGLPPPGDLRSCLAALSDDEDLLTQLFQYRFSEGDGLDGHSFGNLFLAALAGVTGSFDRGVLEAGRVLTIRGRVLPSTLSNVALVAEKTPAMNAQAVQIEGESSIPGIPGRIQRVALEPNNPPAYPEAIHDLLNADMIIVGPGSLYTSVLPNLLVPEIAAALKASRAFKVYVCNIASQPGETDGYDCLQHLAALEDHVGAGCVDIMVVNDRQPDNLPAGVSLLPTVNLEFAGTPVYATDLVDEARPWRHDSTKLAGALIALLEERTGPLDASAVRQLETLTGLN